MKGVLDEKDTGGIRDPHGTHGTNGSRKSSGINET